MYVFLIICRLVILNDYFMTLPANQSRLPLRHPTRNLSKQVNCGFIEFYDLEQGVNLCMFSDYPQIGCIK